MIIPAFLNDHTPPSTSPHKRPDLAFISVDVHPLLNASRVCLCDAGQARLSASAAVQPAPASPRLV
eukprot:1458589-Pleurochrysis_carterae.AAC.1